MNKEIASLFVRDDGENFGSKLHSFMIDPIGAASFCCGDIGMAKDTADSGSNRSDV